MFPLISICIPSFQQPHLFERCLQSVLQQDYKNIEIIISDDTPGDDVKIIVEKYSDQMSFSYYHNVPSLGAPANWNNALDKSSGELLMLLHRDDWLANPQTLSHCVAHFQSHPEASFMFGRSVLIDLLLKSETKKVSPIFVHSFYTNPVKLLLNNIIGPPSNLVMKREVVKRYNSQYTWLVDLEFYIQLIVAGYKFTYLDERLVFVGIHEAQITNFIYQNAGIIVRENVLFLGEYSQLAKGNIQVYDHLWRLCRNQHIRSAGDLLRTGLTAEQIPPMVLRMINAQAKLPPGVLKIGSVSKLYMMLCFLLLYLVCKRA